jgi:hypothetical protein
MELAAAIVSVMDAGARVINLSLALEQHSSRNLSELLDVLDLAARRGIIVVAAAGNQGTLGSTTIVRHPWVIPVVACDSRGQLLSLSNLGNAIGTRGLAAPGSGVKSLGAVGGSYLAAGTSVAAAFVTGTAALLWSEFPDATAAEVRHALCTRRSRRRGSIVPELVDATAAYQDLAGVCRRRSGTRQTVTHIGGTSTMNGETAIEQLPQTTVAPHSTSPEPDSRRATVLPQTSAGGCACGAPSGTPAEPPAWIYAIGNIHARLPNTGVEREYRQVIARSKSTISGLADDDVIHAILSNKDNRYLARKMCWVMSIEGLDTFILVPREPPDLDALVTALKPAGTHLTKGVDLDVVIGMRGPLAPPQMCNGLVLPIVVVDQIYSFDVPALLSGLPRPDSITEDAFVASTKGLFLRIMQMADNTGGSDDHRALNYLAVRCSDIYAKAVEENQRNASLDNIEVRPSRLSGTRKVLDVIFTFVDRTTNASEKCFVRVDVTDQFPFLVTRLAPYYDR